MKYRVLIQPPAAEDLDEAYRWIAERSLTSAVRWLDSLLHAIRTLESFPRRCPRAPEDDAFEEEIRQLLHGEYRVLFTIDGDLVRILHVQHGAWQPVTAEESLEGDEEPRPPIQ